MAKVSRKDTVRGIAIGAVAIIVIFLGGGAIWLHAHTVVSPWIPIAAALAIAVPSGVGAWRGWRKLTGSASPVVNYLCHLLVVAPAIVFLIYLINYLPASGKASHEEKGVVERVYREKHYRSQRVGRNHYRRGEPYYEYYIDVRFGSGSVKAFYISMEEYNRRHKGDSIAVAVGKGALGMPVVSRIKPE